MNCSKKHIKMIARKLHRAMGYYGTFEAIYKTTAYHFSNTKSYYRW